MADQVATGFTSPYFSFGTLKNKLGEWKREDLPHVIDRSVLVGMSGTNQAGFLQALRDFGFVDENREPTQRLIAYTSDPEGRPAIWETILRERYSSQLECSDRNGTPSQLRQTFTSDFGQTGDTARKAETFFLHMAREAGITLSSHFKPVRTGSGATRKRAGRKAKTVNGAVRESLPREGRLPPSTGKERRVELRSGGTVTVAYNVDLFELDKTDRDFVLGLVDKLREYDGTRSPSLTDEEGDE